MTELALPLKRYAKRALRVARRGLGQGLGRGLERSLRRGLGRLRGGQGDAGRVGDWRRRGQRRLLDLLAGEAISRGALLDVGPAPLFAAKDLPGLAKTLLSPAPLKARPAHYHAIVFGEADTGLGLEAASFDVIVVHDMLHRMERPWLAAEQLTRLLRPGGLIVVDTLFSGRHDPRPIDDWRFSPGGLETLFEGVETVEARFERTRGPRRGDGSGDAAARHLWTDTVRVIYVGRRPVFGALRFTASPPPG